MAYDYPQPPALPASYVRELRPEDREWAGDWIWIPLDGYRRVVIDELAPDPRRLFRTDWVRDPARVGRPCRYAVGPRVPGQYSCKRPSVLTMLRGPSGRPWDYCERHLFGRLWVPETDQLLTTTLVRADAR